MWHFYGKLANRLLLSLRHPNQFFLSNGKHPRFLSGLPYFQRFLCSGVHTRGSYIQCSYSHGFLSPRVLPLEVLTFRCLTARRSYIQGSYGQEVLHVGVLMSRCSYMEGFFCFVFWDGCIRRLISINTSNCNRWIFVNYPCISLVCLILSDFGPFAFSGTTNSALELLQQRQC